MGAFHPHKRIGPWQRPAPPKRPSLGGQPQVVPPTPEPTVEEIAHVKAILGRSTTSAFNEAVREVLDEQQLVNVHTCPQKLYGGGPCSCRSKIPRAEAEKLILKDTHKPIVVQKKDGTLYKMEHSIVAVIPADNPVRVHMCFDQVTENQPDRCYCSKHVSRSQAEILIANGEAYWLIVQRGDQTFPKHNAIVLTAATVAKIKIESDKHVKEFREWLANTDSTITLDSNEVWAALTNPQNLVEKYPGLIEKLGELIRLAYEFWDSILIKADLHPDRGMTMSHAPAGQGQLVTGGYDSITLDEVSAHDDRSGIPAQRTRPGGFRPDADETADE